MMSTENEGGKADDLTSEKRVALITELMINGARRYDILQYCTETVKWGIKERQIDIYIAKAKERIRSLQKDNLDLEEEFGLAVFQLSDLYRKCLQIGDYRGARAVRRDLSSLTGIDKYEIKIAATGDMLQEEVIKELRSLGIQIKGGDNGI